MNTRAALVGPLLALVACAGKVTDPPDAPADPYDNACPKSGGPMVEVPAPQGGAPFCIDATEVTNAAYATWLGTDPGPEFLPRQCTAGPWLYGLTMGDYRPQELERVGLPQHLHWPVSAALDDEPVVWVYWCDAAAFCAGNGKRLCGRVGGGNIPLAGDFYPELTPDLGDPSVSEFVYAATRGGTQTFVYGDQHESGSCWPENGGFAASGVVTLHAVHSKPRCEGGYPGIFDLQGNAAELLDACNLTAGDDHGGGPTCAAAPGRWTVDGDVGVLFTYTTASVGFRCCADPVP
ncbi:MAG TPA: SUMF1/EgtB/PvdO family nonheme iron enzyme [Polyangiaceae bacterium]|jgi:formylglycine-generating enzyme required for sulfatase activity|nr:SUMF1/EgtB/PvdO family nonheme iron enzyme [Polyangiaceae bacterium]